MTSLSSMATITDTTGEGSGEDLALLDKHKDQILKCLNPSELVPPLCSAGLLDLVDNEIPLGGFNTRCERAKILQAIASSIIENGSVAYRGFIHALEETSSTHMGHAYILSLLQGKVYASEYDIRESQKMKKNSYKFMSELKRRINVSALFPLLYQERLLTDDECEILQQKQQTSGKKVMYLLQLLDTKGPTAHYIFVNKCLKREHTHAAHQEVFEILTETSSLKRKASDHASLEVPVPKRTPHPLEPPPGITTRAYLETMQKIRLCHLKGLWDNAETIVANWMGSPGHPTETKVAVLLESCTGFITRQLRDEVHSRVKRAQDMCPQIAGNSMILEGRCQWVLAKLHRYTLNGQVEAMSFIKESLSVQSSCDSDEDRALTLYCHACILLDNLAREFNPRDAKQARQALECAIHYASQGDFGLDLSHPRIRLAQVCLGSSPHRPGQNHDKHSIDEARSSLENVKTELSPRTKCIYYFTWSDFHRLDRQITKARECAQRALDIATANHFETELVSSKIRMTLLNAIVA